MKRKGYIIIGIGIVIFMAIAFGFYLSGKIHFEAASNAKRIEAEFSTLEQSIIETISSEEIISKLVTDSYTFKEFEALSQKPFGVVVMDNDSAVMWTNNSIIPVQAQVTLNDEPILITESNGSYILIKHDFVGSKIRAMGFLPVRFAYDVENDYLNNVKTQGIYIPPQFNIITRTAQNAYPIHDTNGDVIFYIQENHTTAYAPSFNAWMYVAFIISGILLLVFLFSISEYFITKTAPFSAISIFGILLALLYLSIQLVFHNQVFSFLPLFDPQYYASIGVATSIGDLLIKTILFFVFALFFFKHFYFRLTDALVKINGYVLCSGFIAVVVILGNFITKLFKSLVLDSSISFDIHNFFSLNYFSFIGFLCIAISLLAYFLITIRLLDVLMRSNIKFLGAFTLILTVILLFAGCEYLLSNTIHVDALLWVLGIIMLRWFLAASKIKLRSFGSILIWLVYFAVFGAYIFNVTITAKSDQNKILYAIKKSLQKDAITEHLFEEVENDISRRLLMQYVMQKDTEVVKPTIVNQIRQEFENNYFKRYDNEFYIFEGDTLLYSTEPNKLITQKIFTDAIENNGEYTSTKNLYFIHDNVGNYYYLAELTLQTDSLKNIVSYIQLTPKRYSNKSIYPELLIDNDLKTLSSFQNFNYAIYDNHSLVERNGEYSYPLLDNFYVNKDVEFESTVENGYKHLIYKVNNTKKVVVSEKEKGWLEPVSFFSYLFFFFLIFIIIIISIDFAVRVFTKKINLRTWLNTTLQNKIQTAVISLIVFAFILMGIATVFYISNQYNISHRERLLYKIEAVQTNIDYISNESKRKVNDKGLTQSLIRRVSNRVSELSEIHDMDINIYKPDGDLLTSSQPDIFSKGLISTKMNPLAYFKMSCDKETWFIQTEKIGKLEYLSAYVPIMSDDNEVLFYLNLPYFATEQNLRAEISSFMVTLVNVYVLLLVIAGIIAYGVARSITSPLSVITGKFKNIKLGKTNEPIVWKNDDEIGLLVSEYNKMLKELENSAALLAKSERESAWRDMAKQVAHEIKNPLTPMRLSIQHLQRAMQTNAPNVKEMMQKISITLLEQIDNLAHIASEFSNFAIMPKAVNEQVNLNDILENVAHLFTENEEASINIQLPKQKAEIIADKNQLIRVFNNLLKNAIQSIPDGRAGKIEISMDILNHRVIVKVKDNGCGIAAAQKESVFVPNFTTKSSGMGIGLAMSKNIIEAIGGYIWFESEENIGTTFFVEFPKI